MILCNPEIKYLKLIDSIALMKHLEYCGRNCYQSKNKITSDSYIEFLKKIIKNKHLSVLEHFSLTFEVKIPRSVSMQFNRHRHFSISQESQRYVEYNEMEFCVPTFHTEYGIEIIDETEQILKRTYFEIEQRYNNLIKSGVNPQDARKILPNDIMTTVIYTGNLRCWLEFLDKRIENGVEKQSMLIACKILEILKNEFEVIFKETYNKKEKLINKILSK
jgi:thymidylate synthase (FAD)